MLSDRHAPPDGPRRAAAGSLAAPAERAARRARPPSPLSPALLLRLHRLFSEAGLTYCLSHATAMHLHGLAGRCDELYLSSTGRPSLRRRSRVLLHVVVYKPEYLFGLAPLYVDSERVWISDLERTIIDALKHPRYSGGFAALVGGVANRHGDLDLQRLCRYALRLDIDSVVRRLGFLLELCGLDDLIPDQITQLRGRMGPGYHLLDAAFGRSGYRHPRWRLVVNQDPEQLQRAAVPRRPRRPLLLRRARARVSLRPPLTPPAPRAGR